MKPTHHKRSSAEPAASASAPGRPREKWSAPIARPKTSKRRIFIVDDHPLVRDLLSRVIHSQDDLTVCGDADNAREAMEAIGRSEMDLAIVDLSLKDSHGIDLIKDIRARRPQLPLLVLSMHDESLFAERALRAGANGYISKQEATANILTAIRRVLGKGVYLSENVEARILRQAIHATTDSAVSMTETLSDREFQIFQLIGQGHDTQSIVRLLHLDARTVGTYRIRIREKLKLSRPSDLLRCAVNWIQGLNVSETHAHERSKSATPAARN